MIINFPKKERKIIEHIFWHRQERKSVSFLLASGEFIEIKRCFSEQDNFVKFFMQFSNYRVQAKQTGPNLTLTDIILVCDLSHTND